MLACSLRLSPVSVSCRRWMEVSYSIVETRCAYRVTHLDGYNLPLTSFHHLAWAVGQLEATVAAHQLPELPKPKSTGGCHHPDGSPCTHSELQGLSMTPPSIGSGTRQKPERERRSERASMAFLWGERAARSSNTTDGADGMKKGPPRERDCAAVRPVQ